MSDTTAPNLKKFTTYEYKFSLNGDTSAAAIVRFVAQGSKVLDIGAGSGSITRQLVRVKKCDVVALENNPSAVKKLQTFCKSVYALDLNSESWTGEVAERQKAQSRHAGFDYVIAGDVLEHLYDPWTVLKGMASLLNETGRVIISVPHSGHSTVVAAFYNSNIALQESGILDKTHIRFFGLSNIDALHANAGLSITRVHKVIRKPEVTEFAEQWKVLPEEVCKLLAARECANVYQVVTEAARSAIVDQPIHLAGNSATPLSQPKTRGFWQRLLSGRYTHEA
jgi:2-polyprenyl-3-methyl-5-hydroxy-6-metoxy-1,4-benzoquinol methylase